MDFDPLEWLKKVTGFGTSEPKTLDTVITEEDFLYCASPVCEYHPLITNTNIVYDDSGQSVYHDSDCFTNTLVHAAFSTGQSASGDVAHITLDQAIKIRRKGKIRKPDFIPENLPLPCRRARLRKSESEITFSTDENKTLLYDRSQGLLQVDPNYFKIEPMGFESPVKMDIELPFFGVVRIKDLRQIQHYQPWITN